MCEKPIQFEKKNIILMAVAMTGLSVVMIALILSLTLELDNADAKAETMDMESDASLLPVLPRGLHLVERSEWLSVPPINESIPLNTPVPYVIIHQTATQRCHTLAKCKLMVQYIQKFHMDSNGFSDIGYNFLVGGDGYTYEGIGWRNVGTHARNYNDVSIGIAFIGTFVRILPTQRQLDQAFELIDEARRQNITKSDYKLLGMNQISSFSSPGSMLIEHMKSWPHWSVTP